MSNLKKRIDTFDIMRAFAILFMIPFHIYVFWPSYEKGIFGTIMIIFGGIPGPIFLVISGTSFFLFVYKKKSGDYTKRNIFYEVLKRSIFIFSISTLIPLLFGFILGFYITFIIYWSLFQVISLSMILFFFIPFLRSKFRLISYICFYLMSFILFFLIYSFKIEIFSILIIGVAFPFLPWVSFYIFGLFLGDLYLNHTELMNKFLIKIFFIFGIFLLFLYFFWAIYLTIIYLSTFILGFGTFFILFSGCLFLFEKKEYNSHFKRFLVRWGQFSFSIYYIHFMYIALGILVFPLIISNIYSRGFYYYEFLILFAIFFISLELFFIIWKKYNYIFSIEWLINIISKKSTFSKKVD